MNSDRGGEQLSQRLLVFRELISKLFGLMLWGTLDTRLNSQQDRVAVPLQERAPDSTMLSESFQATWPESRNIQEQAIVHNLLKWSIYVGGYDGPEEELPWGNHP